LLQELKRLLELPLWQVPALPPGQNAYNLPTIASYVESVVGRTGASTLPPAGGPANGSSSSQKKDRGYLLLSHHWQVGLSSGEEKKVPFHIKKIGQISYIAEFQSRSFGTSPH
jgi:hypothetical protein